MLEAQIPGCRIVTFGFDIWSAPTGSQAAAAAAGQIHEALYAIRMIHRPPLIYLGHSFGGLVALETLAHEPEASLAAASLRLDRAGLLLFSCPMKYSGQHSQNLVSIYRTSAIEEMFDTF